MKIKFALLLLLLLQVSLNRMDAQSLRNENSGIPLKTDKSILFGKDIIINDQAIQNQRNIAICSAFNGWLYAVYSYNNGIQPYVTFIRSTDNGITWNVIGDFTSFDANYVINKIDIIACGNSLSTLKIFLASTAVDTTPYDEWQRVFVGRYQGEPFVGEESILADGGPVTNRQYYIALASDQNFTANNSNPFSIALAYTKSGYYDKDTLFFCSSSNGGISFDNKEIIALSDRKFGKLSLSYGRTFSKPEGRYFVAWEEKNSSNAATGNIYSAHTDPNFNSQFTIPICLDSLDPSEINKGRNPSISCQVNNVDNDSANLTEVVLFDKFDTSTLRYDITGYYNLQAANHTNFKKLNISNSAHYNCQPSINFNQYDSTFMGTYYDSTIQKLPFLLNNFNLQNPDNWQFVTIGYNDDVNLSAPFPKVALNLDQKQGINVWTSERTGGNGVVMFDAPYSTYTEISENSPNVQSFIYGSYPSPCSQELTIWFEIQHPEKVNTTLYDISNHILKISTSETYQAGRGVVKLDVSTLPPGCYFYSLKADNLLGSGKVIVIR